MKKDRQCSETSAYKIQTPVNYSEARIKQDLISLWISQQIVIPPALINSTGIWSIPGDLWFFSFSIASSNSKALGSGTSGSAVCISACLTFLAPCTFNSWEKYFLHPVIILWESATKSPFSSFTIKVLGRYPFLKSLMPLYKSVILLILLLASSSSILAFRYAFFLFLKCLLASRLTLFRLSKLLWFAAQVLPIVIWSTGVIPKSPSQSLKRLNLHPSTYTQMQKSVILSTCSIVRNFLNYK